MNTEMKVTTEAPVLVDVAMLKEHPNNPNRGDVDAIEESIGANGWYGSIIAQRSTGYVIAGNHRLRAAKRHGAEQVWVEFADVDAEAATRIMLADNRTAALARLDTEALNAVLASVQEAAGDIAGTGFDAKAIAAMVEPSGKSGRNVAELKEVFDTTRSRQIVLVYSQDEYDRVTARLAEVQRVANATTLIGALLYLCRRLQA